MILFHGCKNKNIKQSILKNGFIKYKGNYGMGIYCSSDLKLALYYTYEDYENQDKENINNILYLKINNKNIKNFKYNDIANLNGKYYKDNKYYETAESINSLDDYANKNKIKCIKINYKDTNEVIIYDLSCINCIK